MCFTKLLLISTNNICFLEEIRTRGPWATTRSPEWNRHCRYADGMQHFFNTVKYWNLWQGNGLNRFWDILLTRLKCWHFQNAIKKVLTFFSNFGKGQRRTIILAILVDLLSPEICAKIKPRAYLVLEKKIFKGFYHIWAWQPSWSMDHDHLSNPLFPQPKEAPHEIWATLAQRLQRRSRLKFSTIFPYKCMVPIQMHREANLTSP